MFKLRRQHLNLHVTSALLMAVEPCLNKAWVCLALQVSQCYKADQGLPNVNPFTYDTTGTFVLSLLGQFIGKLRLALLGPPPPFCGQCCGRVQWCQAVYATFELSWGVGSHAN